MTALQTYLNEVRERDNDETLKPQIEIAYEAWTKRVYEENAMLSTQFAFRNGYRSGFYASYRTDVPKLLKMLERALTVLEEWKDSGESDFKDALSDIEQIARGGCFSDDPEIDRFIKALKTTPLKNTENV